MSVCYAIILEIINRVIEKKLYLGSEVQYTFIKICFVLFKISTKIYEQFRRNKKKLCI